MKIRPLDEVLDAIELKHEHDATYRFVGELIDIFRISDRSSEQ